LLNQNHPDILILIVGLFLLQSSRTFPEFGKTTATELFLPFPSLPSVLKPKFSKSTDFHCTIPSLTLAELPGLEGFLGMEPKDEYGKPIAAYSPQLTFQDPFASLEGGVGSLNIGAETNRAHAPCNATSTISTQCSNFDGDGDSTAASSRTSYTSPISRDVSPSRVLSLEDHQEGSTPTLEMPSPSRDHEESTFPAVKLNQLDLDRSDSPTSCDMQKSFHPDVTPRPHSRTRDSERDASFDGGVDLLKGHGARLCKYFRNISNISWHLLGTAPILVTNSPASITRSASVAASMQSFKSVESTNDDWNIDTLREMTDVVREAVPLGSIASAHLEILSEILKALLMDEQACSSAVSLEVVALTYLDKTLDAILAQTTKNIALAEPSIQEVFSRATSLQHRWQQRFKERSEEPWSCCKAQIF
jgi:hypothetical protein